MLVKVKNIDCGGWYLFGDIDSINYYPAEVWASNDGSSPPIIKQVNSSESTDSEIYTSLKCLSKEIFVKGGDCLVIEMTRYNDEKIFKSIAVNTLAFVLNDKGETLEKLYKPIK